MDSQIEQLPDLSGYLKFASVSNWQRVTLVSPGSADGADTRQQARNFWQHWRTSHARQLRGRRPRRQRRPQVPPIRAPAPPHTPLSARDNADYE